MATHLHPKGTLNKLQSSFSLNTIIAHVPQILLSSYNWSFKISSRFYFLVPFNKSLHMSENLYESRVPCPSWVFPQHTVHILGQYREDKSRCYFPISIAHLFVCIPATSSELQRQQDSFCLVHHCITNTQSIFGTSYVLSKLNNKLTSQFLCHSPISKINKNMKLMRVE